MDTPMGTAEQNRSRENGNEDAVPDLVCRLEHGCGCEDPCPEDQEASEGDFNDDTEDQVATGSVMLSGASKKSSPGARSRAIGFVQSRAVSF